MTRRRERRAAITTGLAAIALAAWGAAAQAHPERTTAFPDPNVGEVPEYRSTGRAHVVCARDSRRRARRLQRGKARARSLRLSRRCDHRSIQAAVDAAWSGERILILPGVYTEPASRAAPFDDPRCAEMVERMGDADDPTRREDDPPTRPTYEYHLNCPNAKNLIAITGDTNGDGRCDRRCHLLLEGTGRRPEDVLIVGDRRRLDVIRADRADGIHIRNLAVEQATFNGIDIVETNGFRVEKIVARYNLAYGILSFTTDHGLYADVEAHGNGDSGVYPGSTAKILDADGTCGRHAIEMRGIDSYANNLGFSGSGANSVWVHDSRFHSNVAGLMLDSAVPGHPGMPQACTRVERSEIYSNNLDLHDDEHDRTCAETPFAERAREFVCPAFLVPIGNGITILGGNRNVVRENRIWDNWRRAIHLIYMPPGVRGDYGAEPFDTSHHNQFVGNVMGVDREGRRDPNGVDLFWDGEGRRNCAERNSGPAGGPPTTSSIPLPACPGSDVLLPSRDPESAEALCATWSPQEPEPVGCDWQRRPEEPR